MGYATETLSSVQSHTPLPSVLEVEASLYAMRKGDCYNYLTCWVARQLLGLPDKLDCPTTSRLPDNFLGYPIS